MTDKRPSKAGAEVLAIMHEYGVTPRLRMLPGSTIELPPPHQAAWEAAHGGKPVLSSVMGALERRGEVVATEGAQFGHKWRWWSIANGNKIE